MILVDVRDVKEAFVGKCGLDDEMVQKIIDEIPITLENGMVSIEEAKPFIGCNVLCQWKKNNGNDLEIYQTIMHRNENDEWISNSGVCTGKVTHWMQLPFIIAVN